jgi:hypothetical protein
MRAADIRRPPLYIATSRDQNRVSVDRRVPLLDQKSQG